MTRADLTISLTDRPQGRLPDREHSQLARLTIVRTAWLTGELAAGAGNLLGYQYRYRDLDSHELNRSYNPLLFKLACLYTVVLQTTRPEWQPGAESDEHVLYAVESHDLARQGNTVTKVNNNPSILPITKEGYTCSDLGLWPIQMLLAIFHILRKRIEISGRSKQAKYKPNTICLSLS